MTGSLELLVDVRGTSLDNKNLPLKVSILSTHAATLAGTRVDGNGFTPTASLLRAVLISGATPMKGISARNGQPLSALDRNQGFGRVSLNSSLPLVDGTTSESWRLQVCECVTHVLSVQLDA